MDKYGALKNNITIITHTYMRIHTPVKISTGTLIF